MANALNISSEEELLQLRDEGKISEAEYNDLLGTMSISIPGEPREPATQSDMERSKRRLGKISFFLLLAGIVLPAVGFFVCSAATSWGEMDVIFNGCLVALVLLEILAFVFGVISWPDVFGKATVATVSALAVLWVLYHVLLILDVLSVR
ncbi:MAG: hypothetical protein GWN67_05525 [Phycisphaerae bacterium]|nr:hypothetical protein [Phycisphaerae bacterium]NIP51419.1 hypothetical protein [Phycisphaerae bacterium]NIS50623.1 hypothetical protein [Phycisphaerae bacterium]NIU08356.1 hypothetical protein [Phycisphaerae bacterium]NIU55855.1 hypothetical protein [Phycisphaerae bacterium]